MKERTRFVLGLTASGVIAGLAGCSGDDNSTSTYDAGVDSGHVDGGGTVDAPADVGATDGNGADVSDTGTVTSVLPGPSNGSPVVIAPDESVAVVVNRDVGSVTVLKLAYPASAPATATVAGEVSFGASAEPWQVLISPDSSTAYVALRRDQKVAKITGLKATPAAGNSIAVGSEPTGIALTPTGASLWVTSWVDGTVKEIDTAAWTVKSTVDLNPALVGTGLLGTVTIQKVAIAHPRSIAITNNKDTSDDDESMYVTEYFAQATAPEAADGANSDTRRKGLVYKVKLSDKSVSVVSLAPLADMGFKDEKNATAGCFPNQLQAIAINGKYAFVLSICESPKGPTGPKVTATTCTAATITVDCAGLVDPVCVPPAAGLGLVCVDTASVKTSTTPVISVIDTTNDTELTAGTAALNAKFRDLFVQKTVPDNNARRFPLVASDIAFVPGTQVAYVSANGADAVFRIRYDNGTIAEVGSSLAAFINLNPTGIDPAKAGLNPIGLAIGSKGFALVASEATRVASLIDLNSQAVAAPPGDGGLATPSVVSTTLMPTAGSDADKILKGKRFFNTGVGRWSLKGQAWGACQACHMDGLSDNVTWYFARGPRQSTSLDGTFNSKDATDMRVLNWTAIFDEVPDFELNTRGVSGGVGAIIGTNSVPPATSDRIDINTLCAAPPCTSGTNNGNGNGGLNGSAAKAADPANPLTLNPAGLLPDWGLITKYMQSIRSPRGATGLDPSKVAAGAGLFNATAAGAGQPGLCNGCHGGPKWTISKVFYDPTATTTAALKAKDWGVAATAAGFPSSLFPASTSTNRFMRFGTAANDSIICSLRPVGTFNIAESGAGIAELRVDMTTLAQGGGDGSGDGKGFNVPSLLAVSVGAPYFHGGNARTLEALFSTTFVLHHRALAANFLAENTPAASIDAMISFLLSIDEDTTPIAVPALGNKGGDFCAFP